MVVQDDDPPRDDAIEQRFECRDLGGDLVYVGVQVGDPVRWLAGKPVRDAAALHETLSRYAA